MDESVYMIDLNYIDVEERMTRDDVGGSLGETEVALACAERENRGAARGDSQ